MSESTEESQPTKGPGTEKSRQRPTGERVTRWMTVVSAAATAFLAFMAWSASNVNEKTLSLMREDYLQTYRPELIIDFNAIEYHPGYVKNCSGDTCWTWERYAINEGKRAAYGMWYYCSPTPVPESVFEIPHESEWTTIYADSYIKNQVRCGYGILRKSVWRKWLEVNGAPLYTHFAIRYCDQDGHTWGLYRTWELKGGVDNPRWAFVRYTTLDSVPGLPEFRQRP